MTLAELLVGVLAVWRVTHLLYAEDGPWDIGRRLRWGVGQGFWGKLLDCFYCLSLWVAVPIAIVLAGSWREGIILCLGLSGGSIVVQRLLPVDAVWKEDP